MSLRALTTAAWVSVSVLVSHLAAYRLTYDDPHARAHALANSGHGWTAHLPALLLAAALGAIIGAVSTAVNARRTSGGHTRSRVRELLVLAIGGTLAYSTIEIGERLLHHNDINGVLHDLSGGGATTLIVGILFILATAPLLLLARRGIEALVATPLPAHHGARVIRRFDDAVFVRELFVGLEPTRGPPLKRLG